MDTSLIGDDFLACPVQFQFSCRLQLSKAYVKEKLFIPFILSLKSILY